MERWALRQPGWRVRLLVLAALALFLHGAGLVPGPAVAQDRRNLAIVGHDGDPRSVGRGNPVFRTVLDELRTQLAQGDQRVLDLAAAGAGRIAIPEGPVADGQWVEMARVVTSPPVDLIAVFELFARADPRNFQTALEMRLAVRVIDVRTGEAVGQETASSLPSWGTRPGCDYGCVLGPVGEYGRQLAGDVAYRLGPALVTRPVRTFFVTFENFCDGDYRTVEEYLMRFAGYRHHRPVSATGCRHEIEYEAAMDEAILKRHLGTVAERMGGRATIGVEGGRFVVRRSTPSSGG